MAKDLTQKILGTVQSGLNCTVHTLQAAVQAQPQGSAFYPTTLDQLENVKSGWLRKQGGIVKSWHRRYFIMKGDYLYYYTTDDDYITGKQPLGNIFLPGNHVAEIPYTPADSEKFQFEIQTGDSTRMSPSHESYLLSAETDDERKDWIRAIKHFLYSVTGGAIFGQSLEQTLQYEHKCNRSSKIPLIIQSCVTYLRQNGLHEEGLFRLPGRSVMIRQLQEIFDRGERPSLTDDDPPDIDLDVHTVASLLKSYLRELPEPLVPYELYEQVMIIVTREVPVIGEHHAATKLGDLLAEKLSQANYNTLQYVCQFLADVAQCVDDNKMGVTNLATVFAQCVLRPNEDPNLMLATSANRTAATQLMISQCGRMFRVEYTPSGDAIVTDDILGLNRNSVFESGDLSTVLTANCSNPDLADLDFATTPPARHSVQCRPKPADRSMANRSGIIEEISSRRDAVILRYSSDTADFVSVNGTVPAAEDESPTVTEQSEAKEEKPVVTKRPVPARRKTVVRSSSFESGFSPSNSRPGLPVPPPKPNRQRAAMVVLQTQIEDLTAQLKCATEERDAAVARATELEQKLNRYCEKFGCIE